MKNSIEIDYRNGGLTVPLFLLVLIMQFMSNTVPEFMRRTVAVGRLLGSTMTPSLTNGL
nr:hypothetical protein P5668_11745 [Bacillus subtilis]